MKTTSKLVALLACISVSACTQTDIREGRTPLRGFNLLQDESTTLNSTQACASLHKLRTTGANSVIFVPFLKQDTQNTTQLDLATNVTDTELRAAIQYAKQQGLYTIVKPQILVPNSWPGAIQFERREQEHLWFKRYQSHMKHFAKLANDQNADAFIIGTELKQLGQSRYWFDVIKTVRSVFNGELSYAAHNLEGAQNFAHWQELDRIGITLYPRLPHLAKPQQVKKVTTAIAQQFADFAQQQGKPGWIMEIGIPSAQGWENHPWMWQGLENANATSDPNLQGRVLGQWLQSVNDSAIQGVWIWQWSSSPDAGGQRDVGYTVQNKFAQTVIQRHWRPWHAAFTSGANPCG